MVVGVEKGGREGVISLLVVGRRHDIRQQCGNNLAVGSSLGIAMLVSSCMGQKCVEDVSTPLGRFREELRRMQTIAGTRRRAARRSGTRRSRSRPDLPLLVTRSGRRRGYEPSQLSN